MTCAAILGGVLAFVCPQVAQALEVTPTLSLTAGYDDNVRLNETRRGDWFLLISPGVEALWQWSDSSLSVGGNINFAYYNRLSEYTQVEGGTARVSWFQQLTPTWSYNVYDVFSSTYDNAVVDDEGALRRIEDNEGRRDYNTAGFSVTHLLGPREELTGGYSYSFSSNENEEVEDSRRHQAFLNYAMLITQEWEFRGGVSGAKTNYDQSPDENRYDLDLTTAYLFGPHRQAFMTFAVRVLRSDSDDETVTRARDYETYAVYLGYSHEVSRAFSWGGQVGVSYVNGDDELNASAGQTYPVGSLYANWTGERWTLNLTASSELQDNDFLEDNTGLTRTYRFGARFTQQLAEKWSLSLLADYTRDEYEQNLTLTEIDPGSQETEVDNVRLGAVLTWDLHQYANLSLDYRYLNRDSDYDPNDREQNRILLVLTFYRPYRL